MYVMMTNTCVMMTFASQFLSIQIANTFFGMSRKDTAALQLQVYVALVEAKLGKASGFDLSSLNQYFWYPGCLKANGSRYVAGVQSSYLNKKGKLC